MKPKILHYHIPGNPTGGILHIYGEPSPRQDLIFYCGGFPDGLEPFSNLAKRLAIYRNDNDDRGCYVGVTCFPGFEYEMYKQKEFKRSGYSFDEVTCCIRDAVYILHREHAKGIAAAGDYKIQTTFTLITHDWGALIGHMYVNRSIEANSTFFRKPDRVVMLDVLLFPHRRSNYKEVLNRLYKPLYKPTTREKLVAFTYRAAFAISFAISLHISETIGLITMGIMLTICFKTLKLLPLKSVDDAQMNNIKNMDPKHFLYMMYPYYHMFKELFKGPPNSFTEGTLPLDLKQTPVLYIYGDLKNVMFHDYRSVALLEREEKEGLSESRVVKIEGAGHWMYVQEPEICEEEIRKFIKGERGSSKNNGTSQSRL